MRQPPTMTVPALALAAAMALMPRIAQAEVEDQLGLGAQAAAMGNAVGAVPSGFSSVYYNPALLSSEDEAPGFVEASFTLVLAHPVMHVNGAGGADIELATETPTTAAGLVGARFDLGRLFGVEGLNAGLSVYSPFAYVFSYEIHPDDDVQWLMLSDRLEHLAISAGLGLRLNERFSVGASVRVLFELETLTTGNVETVESITDPDTGGMILNAETRLGEEVHVFGRAAPVFGVSLLPIDRMRLGFTYRWRLLMDDWGWTRTTATAGLPALGYQHRFTHFYQPHELVWAAAYDVLPDRLTVSADFTWSLWSGSLSKNHEDLQGRFGDTLNPSVGARYTAEPWLDLMAGYRYLPAYFDNFGGPTNFLDNDQHVGSLGVEGRLDELLDLPTPLVVRGAFRFAWHVEREEDKDRRRFESDSLWMANPGQPGYRYGGFVPSMQLEVEGSW